MSRHLAHTFLDAIVLTLLRTFVDTLVDAYVDTFGGYVSACDWRYLCRHVDTYYEYIEQYCSCHLAQRDLTRMDEGPKSFTQNCVWTCGSCMYACVALTEFRHILACVTCNLSCTTLTACHDRQELAVFVSFPRHAHCHVCQDNGHMHGSKWPPRTCQVQVQQFASHVATSHSCIVRLPCFDMFLIVFLQVLSI